MAKTQLPHSSGSLGSIASQGTRPHMLQLRVPRPQLKILPAATETLSSQINKYFTKTKTCPYMKIKSGKPASSGHVLDSRRKSHLLCGSPPCTQYRKPWAPRAYPSQQLLPLQGRCGGLQFIPVGLQVLV